MHGRWHHPAPGVGHTLARQRRAAARHRLRQPGPRERPPGGRLDATQPRQPGRQPVAQTPAERGTDAVLHAPGARCAHRLRPAAGQRLLDQRRGSAGVASHPADAPHHARHPAPGRAARRLGRLGAGLGPARCHPHPRPAGARAAR